MAKWFKGKGGGDDWEKVSQAVPDEVKTPAAGDGEWGKVSRMPVTWDVLSKDPNAPAVRVGETKAERQRREQLEQVARDKEESERLLTEQKAAAEAEKKAALAKAEKTRRDAEAEATKAEREMREAEEERNHDINRKKAVRAENERAEDTVRRSEHKVIEADAEKNNVLAEAKQAEAKDMRKGILTETFARKAERVLKVVRPIALSLLLAVGAIAGSIFMLRLAFSDVCRPSIGNSQGYTPTGPSAPPVAPLPPVDPNAPRANPDGEGKPRNQGAWGWDKYYKPDGQKVEPNRLIVR